MNAKVSAQEATANERSDKFGAVKLRVLLGLSVLWLAPTLACGSFAPRPTPTPSPVAPPTDLAVGVESPTVAPTAILIVEDTPVPDPAAAITGTTGATNTQGVTIATPAATPAPPPNVLAPGNQARVTAPGGLNMRAAATTGGNLIIQLGTGVVVTIVEGPVTADGYTWWRIDDGGGNVGWAVQGDGSTEFLSPSLGEPMPVDRSPRVGERVVINSQVSVRALPSTSANLLTYANQGTQFNVLAGPQSADGFVWFQIRSDDGTIEGWAAEGDGTTRWISPLE